MGLKFRRGTNAQKSGSLAFGEPYVNTDLGTLQIGGATGDITLGASGTGSQGTFSGISGSSIDITGNAKIDGNLTLGGAITIGDASVDTVNVIASLSSSLIPQTTNAFDLGSATKIWRDLYISTGSIKFVEGTSVVKTLSAATLTALETSTGSYATTGSNNFYGTQTITGSLLADMSTGPAVFRTPAGTALVVSGGVEINNGFSYPVVIKDNLYLSGSATLGDSTANTIAVSGSLKVNSKAIFASQYGIGTAVEITGGVEINNGVSYPVVIKDNFVVSGSTILGDSNTDLIEISGSLKTNQKATFGYQYGTALEVTGGVEINNGPSYPVVIKDNLVVTGSISGSNIVATTGIYGNIYATNGVVSGSSQITYASISSIPSGIISGSIQVNGASINGNMLTIGTTGISLGSTQTSLAGLVSVTSTGFTGALTGNASTATTLATARTINGTSFDGGSNITIPNLVSGSSQITAGSTTNFATDVKTQLNSNTVVSGSSQITATSTTGFATGVKTQLDANTVVSGSTQVIGILSSLNTYTGSNNTTNTTQDTRLTALEASASTALSTNGTQATSITNLNSTTASLNTSVSNLNTFSGSALTRLDNLEGKDFSITLTGDVTGTGTVTNLSNVSFATTVAANSVALGTDTTGDYVATMTAGTGITVGTATGEGSTPVITNTGVTSNVAGTGVSVSGATGAVTISIGQAVATSSNVQFNSLGIGMAASATAGRIDATNDVVAFSSSDIRFKENIVPIENALDKISKISGNTYDWKAENKIEHGYEGNDVGVIAQEIEVVLPQLVQTRENGFKAVKYDKLVALLIEGIKEQQQNIDNLTIQVEELKKAKGL